MQNHYDFLNDLGFGSECQIFEEFVKRKAV
jgi:hypothetical protein